MNSVNDPAPMVPPVPTRLPETDAPRLTVRHLFTGVAFVLLLLTVVVPNSLPVPTAAVMGLAFLLAVPGMRFTLGFKNLLALYACSAMVTVIYLVVGGMHGAPFIGLVQVAAVYIVTPFLWIIIADGLRRAIGVERIIDWFIVLSLLCALSVALFFYLYLTRGAAAVEFFFQGANLNLNEGFAGATMHVYGSMIFLCGGFFSSPELIKRRTLRFALLAMLLIAAITSGRSALILSIPMGACLGWMLASRTTEHRGKPAIVRFMQYGVPSLVALIVTLYVLEAYTQVRVSAVLNIVFNKLASGGGTERTEMSRSLYAAILDNGGLGSGQGVGVNYVSDPIHPWRYEVVWIASIFRVGLLGAFIYVLPFLIYVLGVAKLAIDRRLPAHHKFLFSGFVCAFLATNTNPYVEAFSLQWMYVFPLVMWYVEHSLALVRVRR
ncbi:hypothetical protein CH75_07810 [Dyella jiangningensis]|jgi:hypothetical protein|uniref:hypothetical protein n=1 Tax=Dyella jiangningensis TaxID=1379159 RepID=UPI0004567B10|nr:hypothetical protein [Dyella jiangningensis]AHX13154.1 hypothetical protein CH75_07810 [Dyella jiangningensis]MDG2538944.1 hypothetical protein [Dyella jiangningensis]